jgi:hypothetical protein
MLERESFPITKIYVPVERRARLRLEADFCSTISWADSLPNTEARGAEMAKKTLKLRPWRKEDIRALKTLAREKTKTIVIARKLKRSVGATHQKAMRLGVTLGAGRKKRA